MRICIQCRKEVKETWNDMCPSCYNKLYYQNNKEKIVKRIRDWIDENRDKHNAYTKKTKDRQRAKMSEEKKRTEWLNRQAKMSEQEKQNRKDRSKRYYYENIEARRQHIKEYTEKNRDKIKAQKTVEYAVRTGKMPHISAQTCYLCNGQAQKYHHWSYEPEHRLDVVPLCNSCHGKVHRNLVSLLLRPFIHQYGPR